MGALGEKFRQERERRGFSLDDVSNVTKIGTRMLQAIEAEHFDQLPGGVFNKGFVRAYAKHLGLNDEEAVSEYLACLRQAQVDAETAAWQPRRAGERGPVELRPMDGRSNTGHAPAPKPGVMPAQTAASERNAAKIPSPQIAQNEIARDQIAKEKSLQAVPMQTSPPQKKSGPRKPFPKKIVQNRIVSPAQPDDELPDLQLPIAEHVRPKRDLSPNGPLPWKIPAVAAAVILLAIIIWIRHSHSAQAEGANASHPSAAVSTPTAPPTSTSVVSGPVTSKAASGSSTRGANTSVHPADAHAANMSPTAPTAPVQLAANKSPSPAATAQPSSSSKTTSTPAHATAPTTSAPVPSAAQPAPAASLPKPEKEKPVPTFTVVIRATENLRISVMADGQIVREETLIAPAYTSVRATKDIVVKAANGAAVSFLFNGKEIPAEGQEGEAKTFQFDSNGLKTAPVAATP